MISAEPRSQPTRQTTKSANVGSWVKQLKLRSTLFHLRNPLIFFWVIECVAWSFWIMECVAGLGRQATIASSEALHRSGQKLFTMPWGKHAISRRCLDNADLELHSGGIGRPGGEGLHMRTLSWLVGLNLVTGGAGSAEACNDTCTMRSCRYRLRRRYRHRPYCKQ